MEITPKTAGKPKYPVVHVHGAGGNSYTAIGFLGNGKPSPTNVMAEAGHSAVSAELGGPQTWGNVASRNAMDLSVNKALAMPGVKPGKVFLMAASMGGLTSFNWAAYGTNKSKVAGIIAVIPVINTTDIKTNNRGGYASLVDAAYGGTYTEASYGAVHNPKTLAAAGKFSGIPMLIFYGQTDAVCVPAETVAFASLVGSSVQLVPLSSGHDTASYSAVDNQRILDFLAANG